MSERNHEGLWVVRVREGGLIRKMGNTSALHQHRAPAPSFAVAVPSAGPPASFPSLVSCVPSYHPHPHSGEQPALGDPRTSGCTAMAAMTVFSCLSWFSHRLGMLRAGLAQGPSCLGIDEASGDPAEHLGGWFHFPFPLENLYVPFKTQVNC